jgi:hypothetical protein
MSGDAHDFSNIETPAVMKFFFSCKARQGKARHKEIHAILAETLDELAPLYATIKTGWPSLNMVIFQPVVHPVVDNQKQ